MLNIFDFHVHKEINCHEIKIGSLNVRCQILIKYINHFYVINIAFKEALSAKIVNFCYPSDMIDALIKRVSVTYKCYEMYAHRRKKVQLLVF